MHNFQGGVCCRFCSKKFGDKYSVHVHEKKCSDQGRKTQQPLSGTTAASVQRTALETPQINTMPPFSQTNMTSSENLTEYMRESPRNTTSSIPTTGEETDDML